MITRVDYNIAEEIRRLYDTGKYTQSELARRFNLTSVHAIIHRQIWKSPIRVVSAETKEKLRRLHTGRKRSLQTRMRISSALAGKRKSEEHCKHISQSKIGKCTGDNNPFYGKKHTPETLSLLSAKLKGKAPTTLGMKHTKRVRKLLGRLMVQRLESGAFFGTRCLYVRKKLKIWMRSTWELAFARWLDENGYLWEYEPEHFETSCGIYLPDFFVHQWHCFVEIKGYLREKIRKKLRAFIREYPCFKLKIFRIRHLKAMGVLA